MRFLMQSLLVIVFIGCVSLTPGQPFAETQKTPVSQPSPTPPADAIVVGESQSLSHPGQEFPDKLSLDKQKFCDSLRSQNDRSAEFVCVLLLSKMVPDKLSPDKKEFCDSLRVQKYPNAEFVCALVLPDKQAFCDFPNTRGDVGAMAACSILLSDAVAGGLSPAKKEFCDLLRAHPDPRMPESHDQAVFYCAILLIDMGPDYENLTARAYAVAKPLCAAVGGPLPISTPPRDPSLRAQWEELVGIFEKISEKMYGPHEAQIDPDNAAQAARSAVIARMKPVIDAEAAQHALSLQMQRELDREAPHRDDSNFHTAHPEEVRRYMDIWNKYEPRMVHAQTAIVQAKLRDARMELDTSRLLDCGKRRGW